MCGSPVQCCLSTTGVWFSGLTLPEPSLTPPSSVFIQPTLILPWKMRLGCGSALPRVLLATFPSYLFCPYSLLYPSSLEHCLLTSPLCSELPLAHLSLRSRLSSQPFSVRDTIVPSKLHGSLAPRLTCLFQLEAPVSASLWSWKSCCRYPILCGASFHVSVPQCL